jgi:hypothetical protein
LTTARRAEGSLCAVPFALAPPDRIRSWRWTAARGRDQQGSTKEFAPVSLDADGSAAHGILLTPSG